VVNHFGLLVSLVDDDDDDKEEVEEDGEEFAPVEDEGDDGEGA